MITRLPVHPLAAASASLDRRRFAVAAATPPPTDHAGTDGYRKPM